MTTDRPNQRPIRPRHVARSARILSTGLSATAILGITAAFGAADRAQSAADQAPTSNPGIASTPSALAPLGAAAPQHSAPITQLPSPEGTITLPTGSPAPAATPSGNMTVAATSAVVSPTAAPLDTATPAPQAPAPESTVATAPTVTVAPIAPAEPPVELTLPPAPSNGSSGGSR